MARAHRNAAAVTAPPPLKRGPNAVADPTGLTGLRLTARRDPEAIACKIEKDEAVLRDGRPAAKLTTKIKFRRGLTGLSLRIRLARTPEYARGKKIIISADFRKETPFGGRAHQEIQWRSRIYSETKPVLTTMINNPAIQPDGKWHRCEFVSDKPIPQDAVSWDFSAEMPWKDDYTVWVDNLYMGPVGE